MSRYTNAAAANNVRFHGNVFVNRSAGQPWPKEALAIMHAAGAKPLASTLTN